MFNVCRTSLTTISEVIRTWQRSSEDVTVPHDFDSSRAAGVAKFTGVYNLLQYPAVALPCGFPDGLRKRLMIAAAPFHEATALKDAYRRCNEIFNEPGLPWHRIIDLRKVPHRMVSAHVGSKPQTVYDKIADSGRTKRLMTCLYAVRRRDAETRVSYNSKNCGRR